MTLDVVIPCAGTAEHFQETLECALTQSRPADAIYIVDNGCGHSRYKDITAKVGADSVHYVRFEERLTMTLNWQRCLTVGTSAACLLLHDDDLPQKDAFESGLDGLERDRAISCALIPTIYVGRGNGIEDPLFANSPETLRSVDALPEPARSFYISSATLHHMSALFIRRGPIGFPPELRWLPDLTHLFWHAAFGRVALIPRGSVLIRRHEASVTSSFGSNGRSMSEDRDHMRTVLDFFIEERAFTVEDLERIMSVAPAGYSRKILRACQSWPWRRSRIEFGQAIRRSRGMRELLEREIGAEMYLPNFVGSVASMVSDFRYFRNERGLNG